MSNYFRQLFLDHPESVGENYFTHGYKASIFGVKLISYGVAELVHAVIPGIDLFQIFGTHSHVQLDNLCDQIKSQKTRD
jgi:hypothetical protein